MRKQGNTMKQLVLSQGWLNKNEARAERILALLEELKTQPRYLERVFVNLDGHLIFLKMNDIDWVEAQGNYVRLHSGQKSHVLRKAIGQLATRLDPSKYLRIHRSFIVNIDRIQELQPLSPGEFTVVLNDGTKLIWSRGYREKLKAF